MIISKHSWHYRLMHWYRPHDMPETDREYITNVILIFLSWLFWAVVALWPFLLFSQYLDEWWTYPAIFVVSYLGLAVVVAASLGIALACWWIETKFTKIRNKKGSNVITYTD